MYYLHLVPYNDNFRKNNGNEGGGNFRNIGEGVTLKTWVEISWLLWLND